MKGDNNMSIYIQDNKKHTVRHYCTSPKIEKAIETLLMEFDDLAGSESKKGMVVRIVEENGDSV